MERVISNLILILSAFPVIVEIHIIINLKLNRVLFVIGKAYIDTFAGVLNHVLQKVVLLAENAGVNHALPLVQFHERRHSKFGQEKVYGFPVVVETSPVKQAAE